MQKSCEFDLIEIKFFSGSTKQKYWWPIRSDIGQKFCFSRLVLRAAAACCWCFTAHDLRGSAFVWSPINHVMP